MEAVGNHCSKYGSYWIGISGLIILISTFVFSLIAGSYQGDMEFLDKIVEDHGAHMDVAENGLSWQLDFTADTVNLSDPDQFDQTWKDGIIERFDAIHKDHEAALLSHEGLKYDNTQYITKDLKEMIEPTFAKHAAIGLGWCSTGLGLLTQYLSQREEQKSHEEAMKSTKHLRIKTLEEKEADARTKAGRGKISRSSGVQRIESGVFEGLKDRYANRAEYETFKKNANIERFINYTMLFVALSLVVIAVVGHVGCSLGEKFGEDNEAFKSMLVPGISFLVTYSVMIWYGHLSARGRKELYEAEVEAAIKELKGLEVNSEPSSSHSSMTRRSSGSESSKTIPSLVSTTRSNSGQTKLEIEKPELTRGPQKVYPSIGGSQEYTQEESKTVSATDPKTKETVQVGIINRRRLLRPIHKLLEF